MLFFNQYNKYVVSAYFNQPFHSLTDLLNSEAVNHDRLINFLSTAHQYIAPMSFTQV